VHDYFNNMPTPIVSVIINSHNTKDLTCLAIQAVINSTYVPHEICVIENASTDGSLLAIRTQFPQIRVIEQKTLIGFGAANMIGVHKAKGKYLLFLNPDTEVHEGAIDALVEYMENHPTCGACSGKLVHTDGSLQPQGGALPTLYTIALWMFFIDDLPVLSSLLPSYQHHTPSFFDRQHDACGWLGGTALMVSADIFQHVGGWDAAIYMYGEDVELCVRMRKAGYAVGYTPQAVITHHQHKSAGAARSRIGEFEGLIYMWKKHHFAWELPFLRIFLWVGAWLRVILFGILGGNEERKTIYLKAARVVRMA